MLKRLTLWILVLGLSGFPHPTQAEPGSVSSSTESQASAGGRKIEGTLRLFGGVAAGYNSVLSDEFSGDPTGSSYILSALLSHTSRHWVIDGGIGWMYSSVEGQSLARNNIQIRTRSGVLELSPRYRLGEGFQLGLVGYLAFGTDTNQSPQVRQADATLLGGGRLAYEIVGSSVDLRLFAQLVTGVGVANRNIYHAMAGVQLGLPLTQAEEPKPLVKEKIVYVQSAAVAPKREPEVRITLRDTRVFFFTDSAKLRPHAKEILSRVGEYLAKNEANFESVDIFGHADQRGRYQYNLDLSKKRSESVAEVLARSGARPSKLNTEAFSFARPMDPASNPQAWAKNRRVELVFKKVRDPKKLIAEIETLQKVEIPNTI